MNTKLKKSGETKKSSSKNPSSKSSSLKSQSVPKSNTISKKNTTDEPKNTIERSSTEKNLKLGNNIKKSEQKNFEKPQNKTIVFYRSVLNSLTGKTEEILCEEHLPAKILSKKDFFALDTDIYRNSKGVPYMKVIKKRKNPTKNIEEFYECIENIPMSIVEGKGFELSPRKFLKSKLGKPIIKVMKSVYDHDTGESIDIEEEEELLEHPIIGNDFIALNNNIISNSDGLPCIEVIKQKINPNNGKVENYITYMNVDPPNKKDIPMYFLMNRKNGANGKTEQYLVESDFHLSQNSDSSPSFFRKMIRKDLSDTKGFIEFDEMVSFSDLHESRSVFMKVIKNRPNPKTKRIEKVEVEEQYSPNSIDSIPTYIKNKIVILAPAFNSSSSCVSIIEEEEDVYLQKNSVTCNDLKKTTINLTKRTFDEKSLLFVTRIIQCDVYDPFIKLYPKKSSSKTLNEGQIHIENGFNVSNNATLYVYDPNNLKPQSENLWDYLKLKQVELTKPIYDSESSDNVLSNRKSYNTLDGISTNRNIKSKSGKKTLASSQLKVSNSNPSILKDKLNDQTNASSLLRSSSSEDNIPSFLDSSSSDVYFDIERLSSPDSQKNKSDTITQVLSPKKVESKSNRDDPNEECSYSMIRKYAKPNSKGIPSIKVISEFDSNLCKYYELIAKPYIGKGFVSFDTIIHRKTEFKPYIIAIRSKYNVISSSMEFFEYEHYLEDKELIDSSLNQIIKKFSNGKRVIVVIKQRKNNNSSKIIEFESEIEITNSSILGFDFVAPSPIVYQSKKTGKSCLRVIMQMINPDSNRVENREYEMDLIDRKEPQSEFYVFIGQSYRKVKKQIWNSNKLENEEQEILEIVPKYEKPVEQESCLIKGVTSKQKRSIKVLRKLKKIDGSMEENEIEEDVPDISYAGNGFLAADTTIYRREGSNKPYMRVIRRKKDKNNTIFNYECEEELHEVSIGNIFLDFQNSVLSNELSNCFLTVVPKYGYLFKGEIKEQMIEISPHCIIGKDFVIPNNAIYRNPDNRPYIKMIRQRKNGLNSKIENYIFDYEITEVSSGRLYDSYFPPRKAEKFVMNPITNKIECVLCDDKPDSEAIPIFSKIIRKRFNSQKNCDEFYEIYEIVSDRMKTASGRVYIRIINNYKNQSNHNMDRIESKYEITASNQGIVNNSKEFKRKLVPKNIVVCELRYMADNNLFIITEKNETIYSPIYSEDIDLNRKQYSSKTINVIRTPKSSKKRAEIIEEEEVFEPLVDKIENYKKENHFFTQSEPNTRNIFSDSKIPNETNLSISKEEKLMAQLTSGKLFDDGLYTMPIQERPSLFKPIAQEVQKSMKISTINSKVFSDIYPKKKNFINKGFNSNDSIVINGFFDKVENKQQKESIEGTDFFAILDTKESLHEYELPYGADNNAEAVNNSTYNEEEEMMLEIGSFSDEVRKSSNEQLPAPSLNLPELNLQSPRKNIIQLTYSPSFHATTLSNDFDISNGLINEDLISKKIDFIDEPLHNEQNTMDTENTISLFDNNEEDIIDTVIDSPNCNSAEFTENDNGFSRNFKLDDDTIQIAESSISDKFYNNEEIKTSSKKDKSKKVPQKSNKTNSIGSKKKVNKKAISNDSDNSISNPLSLNVSPFLNSAVTNDFGDSFQLPPAPNVFGDNLQLPPAPTGFGDSLQLPSAPTEFGDSLQLPPAPTGFGDSLQLPPAPTVFGDSLQLPSAPTVFGDSLQLPPAPTGFGDSFQPYSTNDGSIDSSQQSLTMSGDREEQQFNYSSHGSSSHQNYSSKGSKNQKKKVIKSVSKDSFGASSKPINKKFIISEDKSDLPSEMKKNIKTPPAPTGFGDSLQLPPAPTGFGDSLQLPPAPTGFGDSLQLPPAPTGFGDSLQLPSAPTVFGDSLQLPPAPTVFGDSLQLPSAPTGFGDSLQLPPAPTGFGDSLQLPPAPTGFGDSLQLPSAPTGFGDSLQLPPAPTGFGDSLQLPSAPTVFGDSLQLPPAPTVFGDSLQLPSAPTGFGDSLQLPSAPTGFGDSLQLPSAPTGFGDSLQLPPAPTGFGDSLQLPPAPTVFGDSLQLPPAPTGFGDSLQLPSAPTGFGDSFQLPPAPTNFSFPTFDSTNSFHNNENTPNQFGFQLPPLPNGLPSLGATFSYPDYSPQQDPSPA